MITNYAKLIGRSTGKQFYAEHKFVAVFLDEGHAIKNKKAMFGACKALRRTYSFIVTGKYKPSIFHQCRIVKHVLTLSSIASPFNNNAAEYSNLLEWCANSSLFRKGRESSFCIGNDKKEGMHC